MSKNSSFPGEKLLFSGEKPFSEEKPFYGEKPLCVEKPFSDEKPFSGEKPFSKSPPPLPVHYSKENINISIKKSSRNPSNMARKCLRKLGKRCVWATLHKAAYEMTLGYVYLTT